MSDCDSTPSVLEIWVRPTKELGSAKEAHNRWPEGRSEQGASKAKVGPPRCSVDGGAHFKGCWFLKWGTER